MEHCPNDMASSSSNLTPILETGVEEHDSDFDDIVDESGKKKSFVWRHFSEIEGSNPRRIKCNYCGKSYAAHSKKSGLSNPGKHIKGLKCLHYQNHKASKRETQKVLTTETTILSDGTVSRNLALSKGSVTPDQQTVRKALTVMIVVDELPFSHVENPGFRHFCSVGIPRFNIPSRRTVARDVLELHLSEKNKLMEYFKQRHQRLSLTTDTWTSIQNINYMVITAHYIDENWCVQKRILSFCVIPNHKGETIARIIELCVREWEIDSVFTITVDNASANDTAITAIKRKLSKKSNALVLDGEFVHLRCSAHILNLIVNEGLKEKSYGINAIRNAIKFVKCSPSRLQKFKTIAKDENIDCKSLLQFDVPTRWNSTYLMLSTALKFQKVFDRLNDEDGNYRLYFEVSDGSSTNKKDGPPCEEDWISASLFIDFLKKFYDITLKFSASISVSSNLYFREMWKLQLHLTKETKRTENPLLQKMAIEMKKKFDKYWGSLDSLNPLLLIAVVLDPRFKLGYLGFCYSKLYDDSAVEKVLSKVRKDFDRLYDWYAALYPKSNNGEESSSDDSDSNRINDDAPELQWGLKVKKRKIEKATSSYKNEIDKYLNEDCEDFYEGFDLLSWWRSHVGVYRILSVIARDVFGMPVSTVASESAFSTGGRVLDPYRSALSPRTVEALICTQNWLKYNKVVISTSPSSSTSSDPESTITGEEMSVFDLLESDIYGQVPTSSLHSVAETVTMI